jgi:hypothetical protein
MRERRQTVEHPFGTIKSWMGATHFQMKTLKPVGTEMALHVLAYNMKRVKRILGVSGLMEAIRHKIDCMSQRAGPASAFLHSLDPFRTCVPSPNRPSELLSRAVQHVTQVRERAPGSFSAIPLKTRQTPRPWHVSSALRRWKDDSNPYSLPRPLVRDKLCRLV